MALDIDNFEPIPDLTNFDASKMDKGDTLPEPEKAAEPPVEDKEADELVEDLTKKEEKVEEKAEEDDGKVEEDKPRGKDGKFEAKIPKSRFDEAVGKEREAREAAENRVRMLEQQLQENVRQVQQGTKIAEMESKVEELEKQYTQLALDGEGDKAAAVMKDIRHLERQIVKAETAAESQNVTAQTLEGDRVELAIATLEAEYPVLNPESDEFDESLVNFVLSEQRRLMQNEGLAPSKALTKAAIKIVSRFAAPAKESEESKGLKNVESDRKAAQVQKNLDAQKRQPASMKDVGLDSDKVGMTEKLPDASKLTQEEFNALPESTKAKMRGDFL